MSDGLRVELELDDSSFSTGMSRAGDAVEAFQRSAGGATSAVRTLDDTSKGFLSTLRDVTVTLGLAHQAMGMMESVTTSWVHEIVSVNAEFERMVTIMKTLSTAQDPLKEATESVTQLRNMAKDAPFSLNAIHNAFVRLNSAGLDPMAGSMRALMDAVAAFGGGDSELNRAALAFQEMAGKGVVQMKELRNQLMMAVPSAAKMMARAVGESYGEIMSDIHTGTVDAKSTIAALTLEFERAFGGAAQQQMETFNGQLGRTAVLLQDIAIQNVGKPLTADGLPNATGFYETIKKQAVDFNEFLASSAAKGIGDSIGSGLTVVISSFRVLIDEVISFKDEIIAAGEGLAIGFGISTTIGVFNSMISAMRSVGDQLTVVKAQWTSFREAVVSNDVPAALARQQQLNTAGAEARRASAAAATEYHASAQAAAEAQRLADLTSNTSMYPAEVAEQRAAVAQRAAATAQRDLQTANAAKAALEAAELQSAAMAAGGDAELLGRNGKNILAFLPLLATGFGAVAAAAPVLAMAIGMVAEHLDLFGTAARAAWENLEHYGTASREAASSGQAFVDAEQKKLDSLKRTKAFFDKGYEVGSGFDGGEGDFNKAKAKNEIAVQAQQKQMDALRDRERSHYDEGDNNEAKDAANARLKKVNADEASIRRQYNIDQERAANTFSEANKKANDAGVDATLEKGRYQEQDKNRQLKLYDDLIAKIKEYQAAATETATSSMDPKDQRAAEQFMDMTREQIATLQKDRASTVALPSGLELDKKPLNTEEILKKSREELSKLNEQADGFAAGIRGSDAAAEQLAEVWQRMAKGMNQSFIEKLIENIKEAKTQADELDKILRGGDKLDKTYQDAIDKVNAHIFEMKNGDKSPADQIQARKDAGEFAGYGGSSPMNQHLIDLRHSTEQAATGAHVAGAAFQQAFGPTLVSMLQAVTSEFGKMPTLLGAIVDRISGKLTLQVGTPNIAAAVSGSMEQYQQAISKIESGSYAGDYSRKGPVTASGDQALGRYQVMASNVPSWTKEATGTAMSKDDFLASSAAQDAVFNKRFGDMLTKMSPDNAASTWFTGGPMNARNGPKTDGYTSDNEYVKKFHDNMIALGGNANLPDEANTDKKLGAGGTMDKDLRQQQAIDAQVTAAKKFSDLQKEMEKSKLRDDVVADGDGKTYGNVIAAIKENGAKAGFSNDPKDPHWAPLLKQAQDTDASLNAADKHKKDVTAADSSSKGVDELGSKAQEEVEQFIAKLGKGGDALSEALIKISQQLDKNYVNAVNAHGATSPEADKASDDQQDVLDTARNAEIAKAADAAQKKTSTLQLASMGQVAADQDRVNKLKTTYAEDLANFTGTEQQKLALKQTFDANIAAEESALASKTPLGKQMQDWADMSKNLQTGVTSFMSSSVDTLSQQLVTGKANWSSLSTSILTDMTSMGLKMGVSSIFNGLGGSSMLTGLMGGGSKVGGAAVPTTGGGGSKLAAFGIHHAGMGAGLVGAGSAPTRILDWSHFANAPKFHTGGVVGSDEVPIIARKGEGVFTPEQMQAMGHTGKGNNPIQIHNVVSVNANGGSSDQNKDLAAQVGAHVERIARSTVADELRNQMRPGNMLNQ